MRSPLSDSGGASSLHTGMAWGQRGWKGQPGGGAEGSGTSPARMILLLRKLELIRGMAEMSAFV